MGTLEISERNQTSRPGSRGSCHKGMTSSSSLSSLSKLNSDKLEINRNKTALSNTKLNIESTALKPTNSSPNISRKFDEKPETCVGSDRKNASVLTLQSGNQPVKSKPDEYSGSSRPTSSDSLAPLSRKRDGITSSTVSQRETTRPMQVDKSVTETEKTSSNSSQESTTPQYDQLRSESIPSSSSSHQSSECEIVSTPPTPTPSAKETGSSSDKPKQEADEVSKEQQSFTKDQDLSGKEHQPTLTKGLTQQKQPQSIEQQPLKNTPVRPSWKKQKSLRHIPIYPIHDNELSPRYEPFRKSMDDTSSTNSVSSLASDASGLTTDSGYGKSVVTDDTINSSKETLLDHRGNLVIEPEDTSFSEENNKSGSNDNVFKMGASDVDADGDSGFCPELDLKKDGDENTDKYQNHIAKISHDNTPDVISDKEKVLELTPKEENSSTKPENADTSTNGASTTRAPKSEFLRRRMSGIVSEDSLKEKTNSLKTEISTRKPATRPKDLDISSSFMTNMYKSKRHGVEKNSNQPDLSSSSSKSVNNIDSEPGRQQNSDSSLLRGENLKENSTYSKLVSRDKTAESSKDTRTGRTENPPISNDVSLESKDITPQTPEETCPTFATPLSDISVTYGSKAVLKCHVMGTPMPEVQWLHDRKPLESKATTSSFCPTTGLCILTVLETFTDHIGTYSCLASNSAGSVTTSARLTIATSKKSDGLAIEGPVSLPPRAVSLTPKAATLTRQTTLTLKLNFVGEPTPTITWKQGEKDLVNGDGRVSIVTDKGSSILTIDHLTGMDTGKVTAVLTSSIGSDQTSANVCVEDIPGPPLGKPHIYGINRESASLSWCGPSSSGGSNINYYVIEAKTRQQATWDVLVPQCKELSYHVFGLTPSSTYQFRVRAANKEGLGPPSEPSERVITSDPFSPLLESDDELPFEPRDVQLNKTEKFEDHYDTGPVVGKGKFGTVYKCTQKSDSQNRTWAAKVLKCREKDKAAIRQEVEIMNRLRHPKLLMLWDAFESPRQMVLVMEFIGAGELFERVIGEDFVLTERDCIHFVRQICEGVSYMHSTQVLHLDLKPENILCIAENSNRIKIIDFGLARFFTPGHTKVLLGTPEFVAPEVINYDDIGFGTDMWSIGVICYVLLSGLSPFLGDNDAETLSNVTMGDFDFDDEAFDEISDDAKDFISKLLIKRKEKRMLTEDCMKHSWLNGDEVDGMRYKRLNTDRLKHFMVRRKWLKTGNAVLAVSRLMKTASLSSFGSRSDSGSTTPRSPVTNDDMLSATSSSPVQQNGDVEIPDTYTQNSESENSLVFKDQNDNKLLAGEVIVGSEDGDKSGDSLPLLQMTSDNQSSTFHNGDNDTADAKVIQESQPETSSPTALSSTFSGNNSSTSSSSSSASTLCSSTVSILPSPSQQPSFSREMSDSKAFVGDIVRFDVSLTGVPFPDVAWYFEEEQLRGDSKYSIECNQTKGTCSLIIRSVEDDDDGEYVCKAVNSNGEAICTAELSVLDM